MLTITEKVMIADYLNYSGHAEFPAEFIRAEPGVRIFDSIFYGPAALGANARVGPNVVAGRYLGMNRDSYIARSAIGNYCTIGARAAINPYNHPHEWLSVHEFQYHQMAFDFVPEYRRLERLSHSCAPGSQMTVSVGNDVWMGHNVNVLGGVNIGDGAVLAAGAVVTHDVAPYAIVGGVPAKIIRFRFSKEITARLLAVKWWDLPLEKLSGLPFHDVEACLGRLEAIRRTILS